MGRSVNSCDNGEFTASFCERGGRLPIKMGEVYPSGSSNTATKYIELAGTSGTLTQPQVNLLTKDLSNLIKLDDAFYRLQLKRPGSWTYTTTDENINGQKIIVISLADYSWSWSNIENPVVAEHIADTDIHIQAGEREFWNNKLNCEIDGMDAEHLIINRN